MLVGLCMLIIGLFYATSCAFTTFNKGSDLFVGIVQIIFALAVISLGIVGVSGALN